MMTVVVVLIKAASGGQDENLEAGAEWKVRRTWQLRQSGLPGDAAPYVPVELLPVGYRGSFG